jgi:hypothetical protein
MTIRRKERNFLLTLNTKLQITTIKIFIFGAPSAGLFTAISFDEASKEDFRYHP